MQGLKIKKVPLYINELGYSDSGTIFRCKRVIFDTDAMKITIEWEVQPSNWAPGTIKRIVPQDIPFNWSDDETSGLIKIISDLLHEMSMNRAFMMTPEGLKSFADMKAETLEVEI